jgi:hypothetical protein
MIIKFISALNARMNAELVQVKIFALAVKLNFFLPMKQKNARVFVNKVT